MAPSHSSWEKQLQVLTWLIHYLFVAPLLLVIATFVFYHPDPTRWSHAHETVFYWLVVIELCTFPAMGWLHRQLICLQSLEMRTRGVGIESAFAAFRIGMFLSAAFGELCILTGIVFYLIARDPNYLGVFIGLGGFHYILATVWLRRAFDDFSLLSQSAPSSVRNPMQRMEVRR